jgi:hypothetical protein
MYWAYLVYLKHSNKQQPASFGGCHLEWGQSLITEFSEAYRFIIKLQLVSSVQIPAFEEQQAYQSLFMPSKQQTNSVALSPRANYTN